MPVIRILVSGIAALVSTSASEIVVLMPKVERSYWQACGSHIPTHHPHLAFRCQDWDYYPDDRPKKSIGTNDDRICWVKLEHQEIEINGLGNPPRREDPNVPLLMQRNVPLDSDNQLKAIDWLPQMSDMAAEHSRVASSLLADDAKRVLDGRMQFPFSQRRSCGLIGQAGESEQGYMVPKYVFKEHREESDFLKRSQALASAAVFDIELVNNSNVEIRLVPIGGGGETFYMRLKQETPEVVDLGLTQLVSNEEMLLHAVGRLFNQEREGRDSHFRVYYSLSRNPVKCWKKPPAVPVPFRTQMCRRVTMDLVDDSCKSKILYPDKASFKEDYKKDHIAEWLKDAIGQIVGDHGYAVEEAMHSRGSAVTSRDADYALWAVLKLLLDESDRNLGHKISPVRAPEGYELMNYFGPPLCTPMHMDGP